MDEFCEICQNPTDDSPYCSDCLNDLYELEMERIDNEINPDLPQ